MIEHLTRLARIIHALRQGRTVTSGPFVEEMRRGSRTTQEWFFVGEWRVTRDKQLMHRLSVTLNKAVGDNAEPTDWSPQDIMQASATWNADALEALPDLPEKGVDKAVDLIMALADGDWHPVHGHHVRMIADTTPRADEACPWTFEERGYDSRSSLRPLQHMLTDLVFMRNEVK